MTSFSSQIQKITQSMLTPERLWELAGFEPNLEQKNAILHVDGPLYLTAGPGSGKTRVLLWRTLNLLVFHDVQPEEIFLSTFTEKAAHQLKEGLQALLGLVTNLSGQPYDLTPMYIGTVHSLCQRILADWKRFSIDRHYNRPPTLRDALGQYFHLSKRRTWNGLAQRVGLGEDANSVINAMFGITSRSKHVAVTNCLALFNRFSEECIDPDRALRKLQTGDTELLAYLGDHELDAEQVALLLRLYIAYKESLADENGAGLTDFALLQQEAFRVLQAFEGSGHVFRHVIVDEYQDTNTIQERIFFKLAAGSGNICVVGDDDQALYRFRGATVENFVEFPTRCGTFLDRSPRRISLSTNYRSRRRIVDFYKTFMEETDWSKGNGQDGFYRVMDKNIEAHRRSPRRAVVASTPAHPNDVCAEVAQLVRRLVDEGKVENPNQIAFLYPSMKYRGDMTVQVRRMKDALEAVGLDVYAPRAGRFLDVEESYDVFGLFVQVFGRPSLRDMRGHDYARYKEWLTLIEEQGACLIRDDPLLKQYVQDRRAELARAAEDYQALLRVVERNHWDLSAPYHIETMKRTLYGAAGLSGEGKRLLSSTYLDRTVQDRARRGQPLSLSYILRRVTSIDWNVLDLFYQLCGFEHFKHMFDLAEQGADEGPISNLGLITQYLARFMDQYVPLITANLLVDGLFQRLLFSSYLFALYRLGETEFEDADDPFPKGRIPFLTIHQAKGLEFPVVVLANPRKNIRGPSYVEVLTRPFLEREPGEPLERLAEFDVMRMFYVALSRAKNLLVITHFKGRGQSMNKPFKTLLDDRFPRIPDLRLEHVPQATAKKESLPQVYSFTSDFLMYKKCPRQYMIFRKYGFVPSRSQTMFFGSLVHRTLEELHHELIRRRQAYA
jgi:DNA helicase-2/ATP-dependent DNA helicase PcrA